MWRNLSATSAQVKPAQLVSVLVGCVHLENLSLRDIDKAFVDCLPPHGLLTLRHLTITEYVMGNMDDAAFGRLVERLPALESISLEWFSEVTPKGLAQLARLPALNSLRLGGSERWVSDWVLTQLSAAPLVELELPVASLLDEQIRIRHGGNDSFTMDGLLDLIRHCKSLRVLILSPPPIFEFRIPSIRKERISCGPGMHERDVVRDIRLFVECVEAALSPKSCG